ncbi:hypothetical protein B0F90DRAFT_1771235 [Multifurca ochricompacta]|uniref:Uncharacterized protein n=1 Tax=Multifurca ochricompacta TaxID=376703 RepID=A0AAD4LVI8_9AGAM|nr:hypothetical protein B0F90DRAFT_1771235 [Multifurca ochricompacta]
MIYHLIYNYRQTDQINKDILLLLQHQQVYTASHRQTARGAHFVLTQRGPPNLP